MRKSEARTENGSLNSEVGMRKSEARTENGSLNSEVGMRKSEAIGAYALKQGIALCHNRNVQILVDHGH
jgi:hypothetical protein